MSEYLERHDVPFYLTDVISLLLQARDDHPLEFIAEYFSEVLNGKSVLQREFDYVNQTANNRWAFIMSAREVFTDFDCAQLMSSSEYLQLLRLVCPDFPDWLVQDATRLCGREAGPHTLGCLLQTTYARLFYAEFLRWVATCFRECDHDQTGRVSVAVMSATLRTAAQRAGPSIRCRHERPWPCCTRGKQHTLGRMIQNANAALQSPLPEAV